ncbi:MAG: plastocyanin/azurin family copper-binding protein, partial [Bacteroidota bacterium]
THLNTHCDALMEDAAANIQREVIPVDAPNLGFEVAADDLPAGWGVEPFVWPLEETNPNVYTHEIVPEGRTGNALKISSPTGADVGVYVDVPVKPNTTYLLTGWIKTENLENMGGGYGAVIDILTFGRTRTIRGTSDWTWVERRFNTGPKEEIRIQCHLGRWGQYKGTAWFDDLRLVELGDISPSAVVAETVFRHIGAGGLDQAALSVLEQLNNTTPAIRDLALSSFAENWPTGQRPAAAADDNAYRTMLADKLDAPQKNALEKLLQRWRGETVPIEEPRTAGRTVLLQTELNTLKFAQDTLTVQAGEEITLVFENLDAMPHNVVIGMPGTLETIGGAADALARTGQGAEQAYVPTIESVLTASPLVDAGKSVSFTIQVPTTPGDYPFICTFPGHWRIMNGILRVE